jgi:hypothetical protein
LLRPKRLVSATTRARRFYFFILVQDVNHPR